MRQGLVAVGVDVGGTYTDAVAVALTGDGSAEVVAVAKVPTEPEHLVMSVVGALTEVLASVALTSVCRVSLSTTVITNLVAQGDLPPVALLLIPGPGLDPAVLTLPGRRWIVGGVTDFHGEERMPLDVPGLKRAVSEISRAGLCHVAVVGKFSSRNPDQELAAGAVIAGQHPDWQVLVGHKVAGQLSFPRRAAATAYTLAIDGPLREFYAQIRMALQELGLVCPIVVLKADGGTLPLAAALDHPLESVFSGPAASAMGALALGLSDDTSVIIDIGGTTTDLALILDGKPLMASHGAVLAGNPLPTRALAVRSLPVGGDSTVVVKPTGGVVLLPTRAGPAVCLGGPLPTLTDALCFLGKTEIGDPARARRALADLGEVNAVARSAIDQAVGLVAAGIEDMFEAWQREPVYRLWEMRRREAVCRPSALVAIGAGARPLATSLTERLPMRIDVPHHADVANALGAALARTTYSITLHADTAKRRLEVEETGVTERLSPGVRTLDDVRKLARGAMERQGVALGVPDPLADIDEVLAEQFNRVEGWQTVGRRFDVRLVRRAGLMIEHPIGPSPATGKRDSEGG